jgi:NADPH-ferrihemoprotein reductase
MDFIAQTASQRVHPEPTQDASVLEMAPSSSSDIVILGLGVVLAAIYLFKDSIFSSKAKTVPVTTAKAIGNGGGNPRDFVAKMKEGVRSITS